MRGIATDQIPALTMLSAMMPGSSKLLYCGGMYPLSTITRPKIKTNISGCKKVCSKRGTKLWRATWASRVSMARNALRFIHANSFRCGAGKDFPDWARRCAHHTALRPQPRRDWRSPEPATPLGRHRGRHRTQRWLEPPGLLPAPGNAATVRGIHGRSGDAIGIHLAPKLLTLEACLKR